MQIVANKLTASEKADAARESDKMTASFLAGYYRVGGPSGSGPPMLDPSLQLAARPLESCRFHLIITWASTVCQ